MDFNERLFGISPDGGDGSTELMYFVAFVAIAFVFSGLWLRRVARSRTSGRPGGRLPLSSVDDVK